MRLLKRTGCCRRPGLPVPLLLLGCGDTSSVRGCDVCKAWPSADVLLVRVAAEVEKQVKGLRRDFFLL